MHKIITKISNELAKQGGRAFLVGGAVRDKLLGKTPDNYDLEVYGLGLPKLKKMLPAFGKVEEVGKSFGVLKVLVKNNKTVQEIDVSLPRTEKKTGRGHRGFKVKTVTGLDIKEALSRRDFTINSMALDPLSHEIFDPFDGQKDLRKKILRITNAKAFSEDPLRVLRAMQFVGRFGLKVDPKSSKIISRTAPSITELPRERIWQEWRKLILRSHKPSVGIAAGMEFGIFKTLHPQFLSLLKTHQEPLWHPEGSVWTHSLHAIDNAVGIAEKEGLDDKQKTVLALAAFCHDIGKTTTTKKMGGRIRSLGHAAAGEAPTRDFLKQIGADNDTLNKVSALVRLHMRPFNYYQRELHKEEVPNSRIYELADELDKYGLNIRFLILLSRADFYAKGGTKGKKHMEGEWLERRAKTLGLLFKPASDIIRGQDLIDLGLEPGKQFNEIIMVANRLHREKAYSKKRIIALISKLAQNKKEVANSLTSILNS